MLIIHQEIQLTKKVTFTFLISKIFFKEINDFIKEQSIKLINSDNKTF